MSTRKMKVRMVTLISHWVICLTLDKYQGEGEGKIVVNKTPTIYSYSKHPCTDEDMQSASKNIAGKCLRQTEKQIDQVLLRSRFQ